MHKKSLGNIFRICRESQENVNKSLEGCACAEVALKKIQIVVFSACMLTCPCTLTK